MKSPPSCSHIRPKEIQKNRQYFQGIVWVDDRDFQIVKSEGKQVPQDKTHHGQENLFPRFTTWREQVDGKFWFPTYTMGDDTLYFSNGPPVHMKEIVRYTDYKQFKSGVAHPYRWNRSTNRRIKPTRRLLRPRSKLGKEWELAKGDVWNSPCASTCCYNSCHESSGNDLAHRVGAPAEPSEHRCGGARTGEFRLAWIWWSSLLLSRRGRKRVRRRWAEMR